MIELSVIVLTKNNTEELIKTLESIDRFCRMCKVIIFDGSSTSLETNRYTKNILISAKNDYHYHYQPLIKGVYSSMNAALSLASTKTLIFLNSGDIFTASPSASVKLILSNDELNGVFATANILNQGRTVYQYPYIGIKDINTWLNLFGQLPIHQTIVFRTSWAMKNLYPTDLPVSADVIVKKKLIQSKFYVFLPYSLISFSLGGLSTSSLYLSSSELDSLRLNKRTRLYIKFFLQNLLGGVPIISIAKNKLINTLCLFF